jgi:V/A-type H+-transporting ATPase subunit K
MGILSGNVAALTVAQGTYYMAAALPIAIVGYFSAVKQARVATAGISLLAKRPKEVGKAITSSALVETYAIFAVLVSLLMVLFA